MPRVLVRDSDETRFVWISGKRFKQGDFRGAKPDVDFEGNECTPHDVEVSGFYLQETEVTNKEIEEFLHANPGLRLGEWRKARDLLINDRKKAEVAVDRSPAVCINRRTAQEYAASVMGSLPTEAEWEFAGRSKGQDQKWAWKKPGKGKPVAHLMNPLAPSPFPKEVRTFSGQDETEQGIFDMTGSVREWCLDAYRPYEAMLAGRAPEAGPLKNPGLDGEFADVDPSARYVVKGGSFRTQADEAMTFQRGATEASIEDLDLGFRVVLRCPLVHEAVDE